jgi:hypothetical protein
LPNATTRPRRNSAGKHCERRKQKTAAPASNLARRGISRSEHNETTEGNRDDQDRKLRCRYRPVRAGRRSRAPASRSDRRLIRLQRRRRSNEGADRKVRAFFMRRTTRAFFRSACIRMQQVRHLMVKEQLKEPAMRKFLAIIAAVVLFAPVAYATAYQAALIVA